MKICHLTSAHPRFDTRIFLKQCCSLAKKYDTYLIVADGKGDDFKNNVNILDIGLFSGRINRIVNAPKVIYLKALQVNADLYHIHDPELIPLGIKLKKLGRKVIFDAHEDLPKQILTKHYLNSFFKKMLSKFFEIYEKKQCAKFDGVVTATPYIRDKFMKINNSVIDINNFPTTKEFSHMTKEFIDSEPLTSVCYVGAIDVMRGVGSNIDSLPTDGSVSLLLAGKFSNQKFYEECKEKENWRNVEYYGFANRELVQDIFSKS